MCFKHRSRCFKHRNHCNFLRQKDLYQYTLVFRIKGIVGFGRLHRLHLTAGEILKKYDLIINWYNRKESPFNRYYNKQA